MRHSQAWAVKHGLSTSHQHVKKSSISTFLAIDSFVQRALGVDRSGLLHRSNIHCDGVSLSRVLVPTYLRVLGCTDQLQSVRCRYEPPHHERRVQSVIGLYHVGDWPADVSPDEATLEEEGASLERENRQ